MATRRGDPRSQRKYKAIRLMVLARDQYTCYYCQTPDANTVDHIVPVSRSDENAAYDPNNMVACCSRCNSSKGSRSQRVFLARTPTPPVFSSSFSPKMTETVHTGPMTGGTNQNANG
jgi:5-methylcytosine-specific restriction endonuclease McrA